MKRFSKNLLFVLLSLMIVFISVSCQSTADSTAVIPPAVQTEEISEDTATQVEENAESAPIIRDYDVAGYNLRAIITEGKTVLEYPDFILDSEVDEFFAVENAKYGLGELGVVYMIEGEGRVAIGYPLANTPEFVVSELDMLVADLVAYVTTPVETPVETVEAETADQPIVKEYEVASYTLRAEIDNGVTTLDYPSFISDDDVIAFFALENEKYGLADLGVVYTLEDGGRAVLTYPETYTKDEVAAELDMLIADLVAYVAVPAEEEAVVAVQEEPAPEPSIVKEYEVASYTLRAEIDNGVTTLDYPSFISDEDVTLFFAVENEKYGLADLGVMYTLEDGGRAVLTYPETYTKEEVAAELDMLVADLVVYVTTPVEVEAVAEAVLPEEPAEEVIEYPYGIEPIVKAEGDTDGFDLYVVHTNDVHGRIISGEDGSMGYAKLDTLLEEAREVFPNILLLDGGDTLHGTNLANMFEGQTVLDIMNMLGYDAMVPGNHDFNYGSERLFEAADWAEENASFRILGANVTDEDGYMLLQPYQIYDFNGFKVCVLGLTTPDTKTKSHPKNTVGVEFLHQAVIDNAQYAIDLAHEYADFVIVLGHIGVVADGESGITSEYIAENLDGIDLFVDGHSHTVMDGGEMVNGTLITSTGQYMNNVGLVEIHVDADNNAEITDAFLLPAAEVLDPSTSDILSYYGISEVPDDPDVDAYIAEKEAELDTILNRVVARIPMDLNGERADVRTRKTNLSKLICDAMTAESGADFTIMNGGGIRASLKAGYVTLGNINDVLPFTNTITVCRITPSDVYKALEHGYSMLPEQNGAYAQTDLSVVYSASAPAGEKIKRVYLDGTLLDKNDTTTEYLVATNDFMAAGGDGYTMFGSVVTEGNMLNEVFIDYLTELYPIN